MDAKLVFLAGLVGVGGYVGHKVMTYDPNVVPYSKAQVQAMLENARITFPRRDGDGNVSIWGAGRNADGVALAMKYAEADWAPQIDCQAVVTELAPDKSRVVARCGSRSSDSAIGHTQDELQAPMFEEFIQSKLAGREFNRSAVDAKEAGIVMTNMGGMQREALQRSAEAQRMQAESEGQSQNRDSYGSEEVGGNNPDNIE